MPINFIRENKWLKIYKYKDKQHTYIKQNASYFISIMVCACNVHKSINPIQKSKLGVYRVLLQSLFNKEYGQSIFCHPRLEP